MQSELLNTLHVLHAHQYIDLNRETAPVTSTSIEENTACTMNTLYTSCICTQQLGGEEVRGSWREKKGFNGQ